VLTWTESGGPAVSAPERAGQGTRFIKGSVRYELHGEANLDFRPEGLRVTIGFPLMTAVSTTGGSGRGEA
jgi:two-component sensor histidine kinase